MCDTFRLDWVIDFADNSYTGSMYYLDPGLFEKRSDEWPKQDEAINSLRNKVTANIYKTFCNQLLIFTPRNC